MCLNSLVWRVCGKKFGKKKVGWVERDLARKIERVAEKWCLRVGFYCFVLVKRVGEEKSDGFPGLGREIRRNYHSLKVPNLAEELH